MPALILDKSGANSASVSRRHLYLAAKLEEAAELVDSSKRINS